MMSTESEMSLIDHDLDVCSSTVELFPGDFEPMLGGGLAALNEWF